MWRPIKVDWLREAGPQTDEGPELVGRELDLVRAGLRSFDEVHAAGWRWPLSGRETVEAVPADHDERSCRICKACCDARERRNYLETRYSGSHVIDQSRRVERTRSRKVVRWDARRGFFEAEVEEPVDQ